MSPSSIEDRSVLCSILIYNVGESFSIFGSMQGMRINSQAVFIHSEPVTDLRTKGTFIHNILL